MIILGDLTRFGFVVAGRMLHEVTDDGFDTLGKHHGGGS